MKQISIFRIWLLNEHKTNYFRWLSLKTSFIYVKFSDLKLKYTFTLRNVNLGPGVRLLTIHMVHRNSAAISEDQAYINAKHAW